MVDGRGSSLYGTDHMFPVSSTLYTVPGYNNSSDVLQTCIHCSKKVLHTNYWNICIKCSNKRLESTNENKTAMEIVKGIYVDRLVKGLDYLYKNCDYLDFLSKVETITRKVVLNA